MNKKVTTFLLILMVTLASSGAMAQCDISGTVVASATTDPSLPSWTYTMTVYWDTGSPYALSHMGLLLDDPGGTCTCADFYDALTWVNPAGFSDGDESCTVDYNANLECNGDPSIPGVDNILLKFEPIEDGCEPGNTGTATLVFYSYLPPAPIDEEILSLVDKFAQSSCFGHLSGDFPSMSCDPVPSESMGWGSTKGMFR